MREHVHLIGVGGTGMTALAGLLADSGCRVTGSDGPLYPPTSTILAGLDVEVSEGFDAGHLEPAPDLVVVGNAASRGNPEVEAVLDRRLAFTSMPRLLAERFLQPRHSIVVSGTHGKTTTSSMLAWVLTRAGCDPGFLIGGLPLNFERPFRLGDGKAFVIEGDEYDSAFFDKGPKFMHYLPDTLLLGTVEFDHADIYRDLDQIRTAFTRLVGLVPRRGLVARYEDCEATVAASSRAFSRVEGYGIHAGRWRAEGFVDDATGSEFRVLRDGERFADVRMRVSGEHNARNALAVIAAASEQGVSAADIVAGLASFEGVRRRLEVRGESGGVTVIDDFAHHPTAIAATIESVRGRAAGGRVWAVLEPRSWSLRRNIFQDRLPQALVAADESIVAPVFRAEDIPADERLDPARVAADVAGLGGRAVHLAGVDAIVDRVVRDAQPGDVVVVMSNGGFEGLHERLLAALDTSSTVAEGA